MKIKVIGAGSIGIHLSQAARRMGWDVTIVDANPDALVRLPEIYAKRYGAWDTSIQSFVAGTEPKGGFDVIAIGTPPDVRMKVALAALAEKPRILQLEKPLCAPTLDGLENFLKAYRAQKNTLGVVGYDHAVAESITAAAEVIRGGEIGDIETIDVAFREHWKGIFAAHPWLKGPEDTYLGYWRRGGGAGCEHSHALHLFLCFARMSGLGNIVEQKSTLDMRSVGHAQYDAVCALTFKTDTGKVGRVLQDVITHPTRKEVYVQGTTGFVEVLINGIPEGDLVRIVRGSEVEEKTFPKKRPDDFYREMLHINEIITGKIDGNTSPLCLDSGVEVMKILNNAYIASGH
ncbi:MAG: Gfo/Idh/MocA family oxidoreductase [Candidatus Pacebacteria bacterium]|nr:Gfo/Idh/MocA family oxidoreductase [Candidatus Paceibacterota bacterium]